MFYYTFFIAFHVDGTYIYQSNLENHFVLLTFQGDQGDTGPPGQRGSKGAEGNRGNQGPHGAKGAPGKQVGSS